MGRRWKKSLDFIPNFLAASVVFTAATVASAMDGMAIAEKVMPNLITILPPGDIGAGTVVHPKGFALTAAHVVKGAVDGAPDQFRLAEPSNVYIRNNPAIGPTFPGKLSNGTDVTIEVHAVATLSDIALVRVVGSGDFLSPLPVAAPTGLGQTVYVFGHPWNLRNTMDSGLISHWEGAYQPMMINAGVHPGNSGGPVTNEQGELIGVISAEFMARDGEQFVPGGFGWVVDSYTAVLFARMIGLPIGSDAMLQVSP